MRGPVGTTTLITSVADLISFYGKPTNANFNDFYQSYNFLQYGNKLLVSRASNINGAGAIKSTVAVTVLAGAADTVSVNTGDGALFAVGDIISFIDVSVQYQIQSITGDALTLDRLLDADATLADDVLIVERATNAIQEATSTAGTPATEAALFGDILAIENFADFEAKEISLAMSGNDAKLKIFARNPGSWGNDLELCIANPSAFGTATPSEAFDGIALDELFEYAPSGTEVGIVIRENKVIVETFTVDFDVTAKDHNNKSTYVETIINNNSNFIFVKDNTANATAIADYCAVVDGVLGSTLSLVLGTDSAIQADDLLNAYDLVSNKELTDKSMSLMSVMM